MIDLPVTWLGRSSADEDASNDGSCRPARPRAPMVRKPRRLRPAPASHRVSMARPFVRPRRRAAGQEREQAGSGGWDGSCVESDGKSHALDLSELAPACKQKADDARRRGLATESGGAVGRAVPSWYGVVWH